VTKVISLRREGDNIELTLPESGAPEDGNEKYLYKENESAITCLALSGQIKKTAVIGLVMRHSNLLFLLK